MIRTRKAPKIKKGPMSLDELVKETAVPQSSNRGPIVTEAGEELISTKLRVRLPPHRPASVFVPRELDAIRPEILRHFDAMIFKLRKNKHKGSIQEWDLAKAFEKLQEEVNELKTAIDEGSPVEIIMEAADVSNMALILAAIGLKKAEKS